jgi:hypothetical protein
MMPTRLLLLASLVLVAGCATRLPSTGFAEPAALERAMNRYYESHATEEHGYCLTPYIDGLTQVALVTTQPDRLVVDVRYLYRDRLMDGGDNSGGECTGYAGRQFTFGKGPAGGVEVLDMSGPRRGRPDRGYGG